MKAATKRLQNILILHLNFTGLFFNKKLLEFLSIVLATISFD